MVPELGVVLLWTVNTVLAFAGLARHLGRWWDRRVLATTLAAAADPTVTDHMQTEARRWVRVEAYRVGVKGILLVQTGTVLWQRVSAPVLLPVPVSGWVSAWCVLALLLLLSGWTLSEDHEDASARA